MYRHEVDFFLSLKQKSQPEWKNFGVEGLLLGVDMIFTSVLSLVCSVSSLMTLGMEENLLFTFVGNKIWESQVVQWRIS